MRKLLVVMMVVAVAACARAPEPLERSDVSRELQSDLDKLGVVADPLDQPLTLYQAFARVPM